MQSIATDRSITVHFCSTFPAAAVRAIPIFTTTKAADTHQELILPSLRVLFCQIFPLGGRDSSGCFWAEWKLPMCFPSTLQPEGSISLLGVNLACSPVPNHYCAEQVKWKKKKNGTRGGRLLHNWTGKDRSDGARWKTEDWMNLSRLVRWERSFLQACMWDQYHVW